MNAVEFHDTIAVQFARRYESSGAFRERFRVWTDLLDRFVKPSDQVMDLGCGSGVFSHYLAKRGCTVTAIDGSLEMIKLGKLKKVSATVCYTVQALPFNDLTNYAPQDVIIASSLFEYMDDLPLLLQQVNALLPSNGLLIASMPNRLSLYRRTERLVFALTGRPRYFAYVRNVSTGSAFSQTLNALGFQGLETVYFAGRDPISSVAKRFLPERYVNNLFVGVYRKR